MGENGQSEVWNTAYFFGNSGNYVAGWLRVHVGCEMLDPREMLKEAVGPDGNGLDVWGGQAGEWEGCSRWARWKRSEKSQGSNNEKVPALSAPVGSSGES